MSVLLLDMLHNTCCLTTKTSSSVPNTMFMLCIDVYNVSCDMLCDMSSDFVLNGTHQSRLNILSLSTEPELNTRHIDNAELHENEWHRHDTNGGLKHDSGIEFTCHCSNSNQGRWMTCLWDRWKKPAKLYIYGMNGRLACRFKVSLRRLSHKDI